MSGIAKVAAGSAAAVVFISALAYSQGADDLVARGSYLVNGPLGCGNCHTPRGPDLQFIPGMELAGGFEINELPAFDAYAANITPDVETGIGTWTDEEIIRAIREGKTPEDEIGPPMPIFTYNHMSDDDARAVVAYLRSIPAVHNEVPESVYNMPIPLPGPAAGDPAPPQTDMVAYGGYIVNALAHCFECHTPADDTGAPIMAMMGAGGFPFLETPLGVVRSANITPDPTTGLGNWTDDEIRRALTEGISRNGEHLFPFMPFAFFHNMTADDINAVIAYLRTIPPVENKVDKVDWMAAMGVPAP
jgi:mono/diheme cytochrome c family protein